MEHKLVFAKILGEIYRIQKRMPDTCYVSDTVIYGLLNGVERVIDNEINDLETITQSDEKVLVDILNEYFIDEEKLKGFNGYYDIEDKLEKHNIDRSKAMKILTLLKMEGRFERVINKMDSSGSPTECRTFEPHEWEI